MTTEPSSAARDRIAELTESLTRQRFHVHCGETHVPGPCRDGVTRPAEDAPFPDGWPSVPSLTVTLDGRACLSAPLVNDRQSFDVGPYKVWITL